MNRRSTWRLNDYIRQYSLAQGEEIAGLMGCRTIPVNPFEIITQEPNMYAEGTDFGEVFDGRL